MPSRKIPAASARSRLRNCCNFSRARSEYLSSLLRVQGEGMGRGVLSSDKETCYRLLGLIATIRRRRLRMLTILTSTAALAMLLAAGQAAAAEYEIANHADLVFAEHDGVKLVGDLYLPKGRTK